MTIDSIAALLAVFILFSLCIFQILLVAGKPLGRFAWGGQHEILPPVFRIGSITSIFIYIACSLVILAQAEIISSLFNPAVQSTIMWALTGYFSVGIFMNLASRSKPERYVMTPIVVILATACFVLVK